MTDGERSLDFVRRDKFSCNMNVLHKLTFSIYNGRMYIVATYNQQTLWR